MPGGRILKIESIGQAFNRLVINEFGGQASLPITTHFVVLAYELSLDLNLDNLPKLQHCDNNGLQK